MKSPFFLRNLLLQAVGDSSVGTLLTPDNKQSQSAQKIRKSYLLLLLLGSAGMVYPLLKAEEIQNWAVAQASLISILVLFAAALCFWWQAESRIADFSVAAATYHRALRKLLWCVAIGVLAMITIATRTEHWDEGIVARAVGYGVLVAGASFMSGLLVGYLFGLRPAGNSKQSSGESNLHPRTNLAEIADWLTKLILGAGLVQLTNLPHPIWKLANAIALGVIGEDRAIEKPNPPMALAIMGFFSTCGLLYGYLWTRYEEAITTDAAADALALSLVDRWLNGRPAPDDQMRLDMLGAVKSASSSTKMRIFLQAEQYRKPSSEQVNERSLPVFQALVEADPQGVFHRSRGQYALALVGKTKDAQNLDDDWRNALDLLNDAIRIRDSSGESGWHDYEFARAICRIVLDPNFKKEQPSDAQTIQSIRADLDKAKDVPESTKDVIDRDQVVSKWESLIASKAA